MKILISFLLLWLAACSYKTTYIVCDTNLEHCVEVQIKNLNKVIEIKKTDDPKIFEVKYR